MFTDIIKEATLQYHQQTEKILVGKMKSMRSKQDYVDLLNYFYGYFGGLENHIERYINASNLADYLDRRKTSAIADDIEALGAAVPDLATDEELPVIDNYLKAFGALYVIEGSTLGGQIISKMIQQHLHIEDGKGLSFFNSYGDQTEPMWTSFKEILNDVAMTPQDEQIIIAAANETFAKFKVWLER
ncbi:biliverdin-producing heme oxygenase [Mucilaginibacter sp. dw_454]|uniref:biliverdin-producing heme oxygenase n=1 Tax=Mucilaginibacter sp. dw_454 TaxID=2720079 RepID=UPI001BD21946|nr:biliverdin-producing heme oxygenase [Mucilaginibacter sp. dw_454]